MTIFYQITSSSCTWSISCRTIQNGGNVSKDTHIGGSAVPPGPTKLVQASMIHVTPLKVILHPWINLCFFSRAHIHFTWIHGPTSEVNRHQVKQQQLIPSKEVPWSVPTKGGWPTNHTRVGWPPLVGRPPKYTRQLQACLHAYKNMLKWSQSLILSRFDPKDHGEGHMD